MVLDTGASGLPHTSVAVHVSVTSPPQAPGVAENVEGFDVPLTSQPPVKPLLKLSVLDEGNPPQATVVVERAVIVGNAAGLTWMVLDTGARGLPQASVAVHVSVTSPPHASGVDEKVEGFDVPLTSQPPVKPLLKLIVLGAGTPPQATVVVERAVIVGNAAGLTWMVL